MLNSFHGSDHVIAAATIIEQRPSGHHYERWQVRVERSNRGGFCVYSGGTDPFWYADEAEALRHFAIAAAA